MTMMRMVEQGELDLDAPLSAYLDWWTEDGDDPRADVTMRHLLSTTAGLIYIISLIYVFLLLIFYYYYYILML